jgi:hypothetical protein
MQLRVPPCAAAAAGRAAPPAAPPAASPRRRPAAMAAAGAPGMPPRRPTAIAAAGVPGMPPRRPTAMAAAGAPDGLRDPARLSARARREVGVADRGGPAALHLFMTLPVEQYAALDAQLICPLGDGRFRLDVPRLELFGAWVQPVVTVAAAARPAVNGGPPAVELRAESCALRGSPFLADLRFTLDFTTVLTWRGGGVGAGGAGGGAAPAAQGAIHGDLAVDVAAEVVAPFSALPRGALEAGCNVALRALTARLLPVFVRRLAADYERWAADPAYRRQRAAAAAPMAATPAAQPQLTS